LISESGESMLEFTRVHGLKTHGAHGSDSFTVNSATFVVYPSYYGCESSKKPCPSTHILEYKNGTNRFTEVATIESYGAAQTGM